MFASEYFGLDNELDDNDVFDIVKCGFVKFFV